MNSKVTFYTESDLRNFVRRRKRKGLLLWVEAAQGGTQGFPDLVAIEDGSVTFIELKIGELNADGYVEFEMHNAQRIVLKDICRAGGQALVIVGERNGERLWLASGSDVLVKITGWREMEKVGGRIPHIISPLMEIKQEDWQWKS